ncbi:MAG: carboxy terminal-processing peptidase, partial [Pseudomonadota bacterium]|nr:carboxy terminal-processing peptidase [Pseudomonadota bacterium]
MASSTNNRFKNFTAMVQVGLAAIITAQAPSLFAADVEATAAIEPPATIAPLRPLAEHPRTSLNVVEQLRRNHYLRKPIDDALSSAMLDKYLNILDSSKSYFLASDIQAFEALRYSLDNALKDSDLDPAFHIFNRYQDRLLNRLNFSLQLLDQELASFDFEVEETIEIDREQAEWPADQAELDDLWRRRLKSQILSLRLSDKTPEETVETLTKRVRNQIKMLKRNKSEDAFQVYMNAFASTYDPHTQYFSPRTSENFNINMSLSLEGIGAVLKTEDDVTSIVRLVPAGPAAKSGAVKPTDKITAVGQGVNGPMIDIVGWRLDDVVELIRGPKGSTVQLQVVGADADKESSRRVTIVRNTIKLEEQAAQAKVIEVSTPIMGLTPVSSQSENSSMRIGVIEVPTFYIDFRAQQQGVKDFRSTTRDVRRLVDRLRAEGIEGLIIDLRSNGGGSLQEADSLTGLFVGAGPTVQVKAARRRPNVYSSSVDQVAWDGPLAVMVNRLSASASEIFAGAIQDYGRGIIIGSQTFGKGTVQTLIPLNRGQLKLTAAKFYRVSGESTQHQGVTPDILFPTLVDDEQIGESTLDDAMPWDMIKPASFTPHSRLSSHIQTLQLRHDHRAANDPHFEYYRSLMARSEMKSQKTTMSLNEATRRAEKSADDAWRLQLENELRVATNKIPAKDLDELEDLIEAESKEDAPDDLSPTDQSENMASEQTQTAQAEDTIEMVEDDPLLQEAGNIVADLARLGVV